MDDCLFCKIINKQIPSDIVYEDDKVIVFKDIQPAAPVHVLIVPKTHITSIMDITEQNRDIITHVYGVATKLAKDLGIDEKGFRVIVNCGDDGGQTVKHLHFHLIGGKTLAWVF